MCICREGDKQRTNIFHRFFSLKLHLNKQANID